MTIAFYSLVENIVGMLAGASFHDSYFGDQVRTINNSASLADLKENLRKGKFAFLKIAWESLSTIERNTFIAGAGSLPLALRLFLTVNINCILTGQPLKYSFSAAPVPPDFALNIDEISAVSFTISAAGPLTIVPVNSVLLVFATYCKAATKIFTNPNNYSPIKTFSAGFDLSALIDISAEWINYFGQFSLDKKICIKSVLISTISGLRGPESIICSSVSPDITNYIIDSDGTFVIDADNSFISFP